MSAGRRRVADLSWILCGALALACGGSEEVEDVVPSERAIFQPPGNPNGPRVDETAGCETLVAKLDERRQALGCGTVARAQCPDYVRFAGTACEVEVDQTSLDACLSAIGGYNSCADFAGRRCLPVIYTPGAADFTACEGSSSGGSGGTGGGSGGSAGNTSGGSGGTATGGSGGTATGGSGGATTGGAGGTSGAGGTGVGGTGGASGSAGAGATGGASTGGAAGTGGSS